MYGTVSIIRFLPKFLHNFVPHEIFFEFKLQYIHCHQVQKPRHVDSAVRADAEPYNQLPIGHSLNAQHRYGASVVFGFDVTSLENK